MIGAITFSVALAGFLLGCLIAALITEPSEDLSSDGPHGDIPFVPSDCFESRFHDERKYS